MKVSRDRVEKKEKPPATPVPTPAPAIVDNTNRDVIEVVERLTKALGENPGQDIPALVEKLASESRADYRAFISYLGDKVDKLTTTIRDKPVSFEFDVKRNANGFINTILVKPTK